MVDLEELKKRGQNYYDLTMNEIDFLIELNNPHIIKYYKKFEENNYLYIIMEFSENGDLKGLIETYKYFNKHIPEEMLWIIFLQCMEGLCYIHHKNIIHRDIKPKNIFIDNNMIIKISLNLNKEQILKKKFHGTVVGAYPYIAKEMLETFFFGPKIDIYSMGVSFYEMVHFETPKEPLIKKNKNNNYSKELLDIIYLMLDKDQIQRKTSKEIYGMIEDIYKKKYIKI